MNNIWGEYQLYGRIPQIRFDTIPDGTTEGSLISGTDLPSADCKLPPIHLRMKKTNILRPIFNPWKCFAKFLLWMQKKSTFDFFLLFFYHLFVSTLVSNLSKIHSISENRYLQRFLLLTFLFQIDVTSLIIYNNKLWCAFILSSPVLVGVTFVLDFMCN